MVKAKQRQLAAKLPNSTRSGQIDSCKSDFNVELLDEGGWVAVKIQRVTILVPPLAVAEKSTVQKPEPCQPQPKARNLVNTEPKTPVEVAGTQEESLIETQPILLPSVDDQEKFTVPESRIVSQTSGDVQHSYKIAEPPRQEFRVELGNQDRDVIHNFHKVNRVPNASKTIKRPRLMYGPRLLDGNLSLNQRLRTSNLERKLQKAGGLSKWLASMGLGQFARIFHGKRISKFQLVNLTMEKLKDMGAVAVGPRRKLIHAIDCVCQPYCFGGP